MSYEKELDFALGYIIIFPAGFRGAKEPWVHFAKDCPEDIRKRVEEMWPRILKETKERHRQGIFSEKDCF